MQLLGIDFFWGGLNIWTEAFISASKGSFCFIITTGDSFVVVSMFSRFPSNSLFGIHIANMWAWKPFCGGDKSCISQLIAICSPQATRSKRQTLWYFLEFFCCHKLISVWNYTQPNSIMTSLSSHGVWSISNLKLLRKAFQFLFFFIVVRHASQSALLWINQDLTRNDMLNLKSIRLSGIF